MRHMATSSICLEAQYRSNEQVKQKNQVSDEVNEGKKGWFMEKAALAQKLEAIAAHGKQDGKQDASEPKGEGDDSIIRLHL